MASNRHMKQTRRLMQALFLSGGLNIIFLTLLGYGFISEKPIAPLIEQKPALKQSLEASLAIEWSNSEAIRTFKSLSYEKLIAKLNDSSLVENGYALRDLALATLAGFYHFDISRALKGTRQPLQKRLITYGKTRDGKPAQLIVYPGLTDLHFKAIMDFARTERWPQTSQGLYFILHKKADPDPSLADAFYLTAEFTAVETLFKRSDAAVEKKELLNVIREGSWKVLSCFAEQQKMAQDLSAANRQRFLLEYIKMKSKSAAYLILKTDGAFALKKLDDDTILAMLNLLDAPSPEAEKFALELLTSPRSDAVWRLAGGRLYEYAGEPKPEKSLHHTALVRFVPQASDFLPANDPKSVIPPLPMERTYIVQDGDNLWKIARRFRVDVDTIRVHNKIEGDFLHPGNILKIPPI